MEKGNILLSHKLQRQEGQWNRKQKSDLIDSLLRKYPINATYSIKEGNTLSVIDGVQRLSCVRDFIANKFSLSKDMEPVMVNGVPKKLAGLKFNKLDEDTKDAILNAELQMYELTDCTEKDVREMFRRQNAGKPLNSKQLRIVKESDAFSDAVYSLANHPFMGKLMTNAQRKNGTDRDLIIQTFMLISTDTINDYTSFRSKDIDVFVIDHADECLDKVGSLKEAMDSFDTAFADTEIKIPVTSIPMILQAGYSVKKGKKSFSKLVELINKFLNEYDSNEEYKKYVQNGTSSSENVSGRYQWWKEQLKVV
ncbi:MAG: DUF262 domain-containing protein [Ruminococcus flavefaciens]|nr:DUF262 domain-containing protein [Ruminococcus flavefaciens]